MIQFHAFKLFLGPTCLLSVADIVCRQMFCAANMVGADIVWGQYGLLRHINITEKEKVTL